MGCRKLTYYNNETPLKVVGKKSSFEENIAQRFLSLDPLAADFASWSPYNYVLGNPIIFIDPDGRSPDFYEDDAGNIEWHDNTHEQIVNKDGKTLNNIGTSYVKFTGDKLTLNYQTTDADGNLSPSSFSVNAVSGRPLEDGTFDYSKERQATPNEDPLPEGNYSINPEAIQEMSLKDEIIGTGFSITQLLGRKVGGWPGGSYSWGLARTDINPKQITVGGVQRSGFTIHGGKDAGSAGCIDCMRGETLFFDKLKQYSGGSTNVRLKADYSNITAPIKSPFNASGF